MLDKFFQHRFFQLLTQAKVLWGLFVATLALMIGGFGWVQRQLGTGLFDTLFGYDVGEFIGRMTVYNDNHAIGLYQTSVITLDVIFPIVVLLLSVGVIVKFGNHNLIRVLIILPVLGFLFDMAEGYHLYQMLGMWPSVDPEMVARSSQLTQAKWIALRSGQSLMLLLLLWWAVPRLMAKLGR